MESRDLDGEVNQFALAQKYVKGTEYAVNGVISGEKIVLPSKIFALYKNNCLNLNVKCLFSRLVVSFIKDTFS